MKFKTKITNICAKFECDCELDLNEIFNNEHFSIFSSKKYDPNRFSALICKYANTKLTFLIFKNGVVILTGGKSAKQLENSAFDFVFLCNLLSMNLAKCKDFHITQYCWSTHLNKRINLSKFCEDNPDKTSYEIELFPSAKYLIDGYKITISHKGAIFSTGFRKKEDIKPIIKKIHKELKNYIIYNKRA